MEKEFSHIHSPDLNWIRGSKNVFLSIDGWIVVYWEVDTVPSEAGGDMPVDGMKGNVPFQEILTLCEMDAGCTEWAEL